jgi:hypothetical protein
VTIKGDTARYIITSMKDGKATIVSLMRGIQERPLEELEKPRK